MENLERRGRQARPRLKPGTSSLPVRVQNRSATGGFDLRKYIVHSISSNILKQIQIENHSNHNYYYYDTSECNIAELSL